MICAQRLLRRARAMDEEEMMEIHLENQIGGKKSASNTGNSMDYNSGGLKCRVFFFKWTTLVLTSVCKGNHDVFKSLFCK